MRLFVALDLSDEVRQKIDALLREMRAASSDIKWVKPESIHITLKFIGEQPEEKLSAIAVALEQVSRPGKIDLHFRGLGCFPNERRPRVFWVGVEAPPQLGALAASIDAALEPFGIVREKRAFSPHLTLGRAREGARVSLPGSAWEKHRTADFGHTTAEEFFLYQSRLSPSGSQYTRLRAFPLC